MAFKDLNRFDYICFLNIIISMEKLILRIYIYWTFKTPINIAFEYTFVLIPNLLKFKIRGTPQNFVHYLEKLSHCHLDSSLLQTVYSSFLI